MALTKLWSEAVVRPARMAAGLVVACAGIAVGSQIAAQENYDDYPNRPITIIVPFAPGGSTDIISRTVGDIISQEFGQPVIVDNRPGANTIIGTNAAARATPDGYTLFFANVGGLAQTPHMAEFRDTAEFHSLDSFDPIIQASSSSTILLAGNHLPVDTFEEFIEYAKANPGGLNYAASSAATLMPMELLKMMAGIDLEHVAYSGAGPAVLDTLAGHVDVTFASALAGTPHVRSGAGKGLAVAGTTRSIALPDVPTIAESGYPDYAADSWNGFFAPAGTPRPIIDKLNAAMARALLEERVTNQLEADGAEVVAGTPDEFRALIEAEYHKWGEVIAALEAAEAEAAQ